MDSATERISHTMPKGAFNPNLPAAEVKDRLLTDILGLAPDIASRAGEFETARCIPLDLVARLRSVGIYRMLVPGSHGGLELDLPSALDICSALARIDGSVGWTAMIGSGSTLFAPLLPRDTYERIYRNGPDVIVAGSTAPFGKAEAVPGGWRVSGRWPFASACQHADWLAGFCIMSKDGQPIPGERGQPLVRAVLLPAENWRIEDTWDAAGLKGTGSHDIVLVDKTVPEANFFSFESPPCLPGPLYRTVPYCLPLFLGAVGVGIAGGALDDLVKFAGAGRRPLRSTVPMHASEVFQHDLGRIDADLKAARSFLGVQAASHWRHAQAATLRGEGLLTEGVQAGIWIVETCSRIADACFSLGGGAALYAHSPLQRRMRDLHAAAQHARIHQREYLACGKAVLGRYGLDVSAT
jgi:alkylation response protein AidB-like acyl-CoA dehydrogenase